MVPSPVQPLQRRQRPPPVLQFLLLHRRGILRNGLGEEDGICCDLHRATNHARRGYPFARGRQQYLLLRTR